MAQKGETVDEICGCLRAIKQLEPPIQAKIPNLMDTCGTGGDNSHSFNISTLSAFVVAGAGGKVAKHGNRAASSKTGSADLLEALGFDLELGPDAVRRMAPKYSAPSRSESYGGRAARPEEEEVASSPSRRSLSSRASGHELHPPCCLCSSAVEAMAVCMPPPSDAWRTPFVAAPYRSALVRCLSPRISATRHSCTYCRVSARHAMIGCSHLLVRS